MSDELITQLQRSIQVERVRQTLKAANALAKQMEATLIPSATCNPVIAAEMNRDREIWEALRASSEEAMRDLDSLTEVLRAPLICPACENPAPALIGGVCLNCDELFNVSMARGIEAGVLQMPRRTT